jgi:hypothetical protein
MATLTIGNIWYIIVDMATLTIGNICTLF